MNFLNYISKSITSNNQLNSAIITSERILSYSELQKKVIEAAGILTKLKITKGNYVPIISENNEDFIIIVLALWLIDAVPVPINTRLTTEEIEKLLSISGSGNILLHKRLNNKYNLSGQIAFPFAKSDENNFSISSSNDINNTAVVIFTSGSTGAPKGVMLSFENLIRSVEIGDQILNQSSEDRWLASLPFYHIGGFSIIIRALHSGASIIIPDSSDTKDFVKSINKFKPTLASFVGTQLKRLLDENIPTNTKIRNVLLGGGFIDDDLINSAINYGWNVSKVYGSSETSSFVCAISIQDIKRKIKSSGKALPPNEIIIVDEKRKTLSPNTIGEIAIKSDAVFKGYLNNEYETNKKLINNFYYTGDLGCLDEDGFLFVEARRNDLIITGGENVNPLEVESCLLQNRSVKECCVIGIEDKTWGHIVVAVIVSEESGLTQIQVQDFLKGKLAGFKIPRKIIFIENLPRTSLGKIEKEKVMTMF